MANPQQQFFRLQHALQEMEELLHGVKAAASDLTTKQAERAPAQSKVPKPPSANASSSWARSRVKRQLTAQHNDDTPASGPIGEDKLQLALRHTRTTSPSLVKYTKPTTNSGHQPPPQQLQEPPNAHQYNPDITKTSKAKRVIAFTFPKASSAVKEPLNEQQEPLDGDADETRDRSHGQKARLIHRPSGSSFGRAERFRDHQQQQQQPQQDSSEPIPDYDPSKADQHRFTRVPSAVFANPSHKPAPTENGVQNQVTHKENQTSSRNGTIQQLTAPVEPKLELLSTKLSAPAYSFAPTTQAPQSAVSRKRGRQPSTPGPGYYDVQNDHRLQWARSSIPTSASDQQQRRSTQEDLPAAVKQVLVERRWQAQLAPGPGYYDDSAALSQTRPRSACASFGVGEKAVAQQAQDEPKLSRAPKSVGSVDNGRKQADDNSVSSSEMDYKLLAAHFAQDDAIWKVLDDSDLDEEEKRRRVRQAKRKRHSAAAGASTPSSWHRPGQDQRPSSAPVGKRVPGFSFAAPSRGINWKNRDIIRQRRAEEYMRRSLGSYDVNTRALEKSVVGGPRYEAEMSFRKHEAERRRSHPAVMEALVRRSTAEQQTRFLGPQLQPVWAASEELDVHARNLPTEEMFRHSSYAHTKRRAVVMKEDAPPPEQVQQLRQAITAEQLAREEWLPTQLPREWGVDDQTAHRLYNMRIQLGREYKLVRSKGEVQRVSRYEYEARDKIGPLRYSYDDALLREKPVAVDLSKAAGRGVLFGPFGEKPTSTEEEVLTDELLGLLNPDGPVLDLDPNQEVLSYRRRSSAPSFAKQRKREEIDKVEQQQPQRDDTAIEDAMLAHRSIQQAAARKKTVDFAKMQGKDNRREEEEALLRDAVADVLGRERPPSPASPPANDQGGKVFKFSTVERFQELKPATQAADFMLSPPRFEPKAGGAVAMSKQLGRPDKLAEDAAILSQDAMLREVYGVPDSTQAADVAAELDQRLESAQSNLSTGLRSSFAVNMMKQAPRCAPAQKSETHDLAYDANPDVLLANKQPVAWEKQPERFAPTHLATLDFMLDQPGQLMLSPRETAQSRYKRIPSGPAWASSSDVGRFESLAGKDGVPGQDYYDVDPNFKFPRAKGGSSMDKQTARQSSGVGDEKWAAQLEGELGFCLDKEGDVLDLEPYPGRTTAASTVATKPRRAKEALVQSQQQPPADATAQPSEQVSKKAARPAGDPDPQELLSLLETLGI